MGNRGEKEILVSLKETYVNPIHNRVDVDFIHIQQCSVLTSVLTKGMQKGTK